MDDSSVSLLEIVGDLELIVLAAISLHLGVSVIDDGQEHVEQNEEHNEDVQKEEGGTKEVMSCLM